MYVYIYIYIYYYYYYYYYYYILLYSDGSGGAACLSATCLTHVFSSRAAGSFAYHGDPRRDERHIEQTRP